MKRRNALKIVTLATSGGVILPSVLFSACQSDGYQPLFFTKKTIHLLNEIAETILPTMTTKKLVFCKMIGLINQINLPI